MSCPATIKKTIDTKTNHLPFSKPFMNPDPHLTTFLSKEEGRLFSVKQKSSFILFERLRRFLSFVRFVLRTKFNNKYNKYIFMFYKIFAYKYIQICCGKLSLMSKNFKQIKMLTMHFKIHNVRVCECVCVRMSVAHLQFYSYIYINHFCS